MNEAERSRRRLLLLTIKLVAWSSLLHYGRVFAQAPLPPGGIGSEPEDPSKIKIDREVYEKWLRDVRAAAEALAEESGTTYRPEVFDAFNKNASETLRGNGYRIPNPPTNLRIE